MPVLTALLGGGMHQLTGWNTNMTHRQSQTVQQQGYKCNTLRYPMSLCAIAEKTHDRVHCLRGVTLSMIVLSLIVLQVKELKPLVCNGEL